MCGSAWLPSPPELGTEMNGYNFTDRVRKVLQMAREEAARLHHEYVGTEHILLGLIREGEGGGGAGPAAPQPNAPPRSTPKKEGGRGKRGKGRPPPPVPTCPTRREPRRC